MKKLLVLTLGAVMLLTGCGEVTKTTEKNEDRWANTTYWEDIETEEIIVEDIIVEDIIVEDIIVEDCIKEDEVEETMYVSDEYLEELEANSRTNYWGR